MLMQISTKNVHYAEKKVTLSLMHSPSKHLPVVSYICCKTYLQHGKLYI